MTRLFTFNQKIAVQVGSRLRQTSVVVGERPYIGDYGRILVTHILVEGRLEPLPAPRAVTVNDYVIAAEAPWHDDTEPDPHSGAQSELPFDEPSGPSTTQ